IAEALRILDWRNILRKSGVHFASNCSQGSVAPLAVHYIAQLLAALKRVHLVEHRRHQIARIRLGSAVRRDEDARMAPERAVGGQGLGGEDVEASLQQRAVIERPQYVLLP